MTDLPEGDHLIVQLEQICRPRAFSKNMIALRRRCGERNAKQRTSERKPGQPAQQSSSVQELSWTCPGHFTAAEKLAVKQSVQIGGTQPTDTDTCL